jgi:hypothetical protein
MTETTIGRPQAATPSDPRVAALRAGPEAQLIRSLREKSIAVSSGKGGVGKTITACNLAISYARAGLRVGLADLDPLSDVASLLDLQDAEQTLTESTTAWTRPVFQGLDILFPYQKLSARAAAGLLEEIYRVHLAEIEGRYDIVIFDMPAGMDFEENLLYLPFMKRLVLVTNPEPTAHASAGAYAKEVQRRYPGTRILLWHNRYARLPRVDFHPSDVAGNYNRLVPDPDRLSTEEALLLSDFAFVPEDPTLDLLHGEPGPGLHALRAMRDGIEYARGRLLQQATRKLGIPPRMRDVVTAYVEREPRIGDVARYLEEMGRSLLDSIRVLAGDGDAEVGFSAEEIAALSGFLSRVKESGLRREMLRVGEMVDARVRHLEAARGPFASRRTPHDDRLFEKELGRFLVILNRAARGSTLMRNQGVLLLFYFALHKLFQSPTLVSVLRTLVPRRANQRGRMVRDRFAQIRSLVEKDPEARERYLRTLRTFHGLVLRQIGGIAKALDLRGLVILNAEGKIDGRPYLRLLAAFLHENLYSGLSVIVGFDYRSAAAAFQQGADRLLASLREPS